jgi:hypothetical protein
MSDAHTMTMPHLSFMAWGRKPDHPRNDAGSLTTSSSTPV